ncbi:GNAT family N-acetyltransferase [Sporosarcina sp. Te-1]|uniref:GNAT family N-acetyltransferase n=1 Tax=Sporosarcina sp. Te-1 TaxID=2818390 RepID=UPI001A9E8ADB|nr:GNAT family N-acetyltransferase [Sporosarcina sp. Te-1]QTD39728.1 GNAT family N-acetyltransferase [Sporosarcina sp. Te-1]
MVNIVLAPHHVKYAEAISTLSSAPQIRDALGLSAEQTSREGTEGFIEFISQQEIEGKQYSRVILDEQENVVGVITLKELDPVNKTSHIGTWIGYPYWGKGFNEAAKRKILYTAFTELELDVVFAGAKKKNVRSQRAQEKLPYIKCHVEKEYPEEHKNLEMQVREACILNIIEKEAFLRWYHNKD